MPTRSQRGLRLGLALSFVLLALPLFELVGHRSALPSVLGRYTRGYYILLIGYAGLAVGVGLATALACRASARTADRAVAHVARLYRARSLRVALLVIPWLVLWAAIDAMQAYAPGRAASVQLPLAALAFWSNCLLLAAGPAPRTAIAHLVLVACGLVLGLGIAEVFLRHCPQYIPDAARLRLAGEGMFLRRDLVFERPIDVGYRYRPNQDRSTVYRRADGDLFRYERASLPPRGASDDAVLAELHFVTDENGYPNPMPLHDRYDIVAAGDSFTAPTSVSAPWPRVLERLTGRSVLNLGVGGYGPQQEAAAVTHYGLARHPRWVVLAYFEGNDLITDAPAFASKRASGMSWIEEDLASAGPYARSAALQSLRGALGAAYASVFGAAAAGRPRFPLAVSLGGREVSLAFFDVYLAALTATRADIEASRNFAYVRATLLELRQATAAAGARLLVVFVPSKEHLYGALISDPDVLRRALAGVDKVALFPDDSLRSSAAPATPEAVWAHRDDQRDAVVELTRQLDIDVLDLTPAFLAQAAGGAELYYLADTHWNQSGHDLAAQLIAAYFAAQPEQARSLSPSHPQ
jgi:hypothetical protein